MNGGVYMTIYLLKFTELHTKKKKSPVNFYYIEILK